MLADKVAIVDEFQVAWNSPDLDELREAAVEFSAAFRGWLVDEFDVAPGQRPSKPPRGLRQQPTVNAIERRASSSTA